MDGCANTRPGSPMRDKITILRCLPAAHCLADSTHPSFLSLLPRLLSRVTAHMVASLTFRVEAPGLFHLCNDAHIVVTYTRLRPPPFAVAGSSIARRECRSIRDRRRKTQREREKDAAGRAFRCLRNIRGIDAPLLSTCFSSQMSLDVARVRMPGTFAQRFIIIELVIYYYLMCGLRRRDKR